MRAARQGRSDGHRPRLADPVDRDRRSGRVRDHVALLVRFHEGELTRRGVALPNRDRIADSAHREHEIVSGADQSPGVEAADRYAALAEAFAALRELFVAPGS